MTIHIKELPQAELEFQMFVFDELADELISSGHDVIKLTIGISELPIPDRVLQVFTEAINDRDKTRLVYPQGLPMLREAIADYYNAQFHTEASAGNIIVTSGTSTAFRNLMQLLCKPGLEVMLPRPYYCLYLLSAILVEATVTFYDVDLQSGRVDFDSFRANYHPDRTAVVIVNSPGNPLGNVLHKREIVEINRIVAGRSFIIHDEIYNNTVFYSNYESPLAYLDEYREVHIVTNGFSKGFRMYTKRLGYAILPDSLVMPMRILQQHTLLTCDPISQYGMIEALRDQQGPEELTRLYRSRAEYTYEKLRRTACTPLMPQGGFYFVLDCKEWIMARQLDSSKDLVLDVLDKEAVAVVPGTDFGIPYALRLSFCNERYREGVDRLERYFRAS